MTKIMVTGVNGFVGQHLVRELSSRGHEVIGTGREPKAKQAISSLLGEYTVCDLTDKNAVERLPLEMTDAVISLAGLAKVGASFNEASTYINANYGIMYNLCSALFEKNKRSRLIAVSSGAVYDANQPLPLSETSKLDRSGSPYVKSKIAMEKVHIGYRSRGLNSVLVRPFNHTGPGQETGFLIPDIYQKALEASNGGSAIKVGDLSTQRDYTDVRDVVRAYADLATAGSLKYDLYNVCSGKSVAGREIAELVLSAMGLSGQLELEEGPPRPHDPQKLYGSFDRLHAETGWQPEIPLDQTIKDFVAAQA